MIITNFEICHSKMDIFRPMADPYGIGDIEDHWPNNIISTQTVIYEDGKFGFFQEPHEHEVESEELTLCRKLATAAASAAEGVELWSETNCILSPFFIAKDVGEPKPEIITGDLIRKKFAGTIFPPTTINVEPFTVEGNWWKAWDDAGAGEGDLAYLQSWRRLMDWFHGNHRIEQPSFVFIGQESAMWAIDRSQYPPGTEMTGSCFPRLIVGLTPEGSLVGLVAYEVLT